MTNIIKHESLKNIPNLTYEGYVWMSDKEYPIVLNGETYDFSEINTNPFIIEALLYNKEEKKSIHVQHSGEYQIFEYDLSKLEKSNLVEKEYLPHRLKDVEKVLIKQIWLPEKDENCAGFDVLKLKAIVFCGFKNKEK